MQKGPTPAAPAAVAPDAAATASGVARAGAGSATKLCSRPVLVIGATGRTGRQAVAGLLDGGVPAGDVALLSSRPAAPQHADLVGQGMQIVGGNLDDEGSLRALLVGSSVKSVYIHALSADAANADPKEVERAERLARVMGEAGVQLVVYNGSAGRGHKTGITNMDQKHHIEDILAASKVKATSLQATLFMDEFWKRFSRPAILQGSFAFAIPADKTLNLISVKDIGRVAARVIQHPDEYAGQAIPLAGDSLTPVRMAEAFSQAQGNNPAVQYKRRPAWPVWFFNRNLYRIIRYYATQGYGVDAEACRRRFPFLQTFGAFLEESRWGDASVPCI